MRVIEGHGGLAELATRLERDRDALAEARRREGAVLLRGWDVGTAEDFARLLDALAVPLRPYDEGLSTRPELARRVFPTTQYPPAEDIVPHNELCHTHSPPRSLLLFCVTSPETGGQTPLVDTRRLLDDPATEPFRARRLTYVTNLPDRARGMRFGRAWQDVYGTDDHDVVEALLAERGTRWAWTGDGALRTWCSGPATTLHPVTGEEVWFNQAPLWHVSNLGARGRVLLDLLGPQGVPTNAFFDDDEPIDEALLDAVRGAAWARAERFDWRRGDLAWVDNYAMAHGRTRYTGERLVLLAFGEAP